MKSGKSIAFVTGAGKGIGEAIAVALARQGLRVALAARTLSDVERVTAAIRKRGGDAMAVACDVTQPDSIAAAVARVGKITILVNNAGASGSHKFVGHDDALWHQMIDVNLNSVYYVTKAIVPMMIEASWGRIINIASTSSKVGGKYIAAYTAAKHGVLGLTRSLAVEFAGYHITVNAICPGYVDTPMTEHSIANIAAHTKLSKAQAQAALESTNPQHRLITPAEVAAVAVMLIGEDARGITGQAINVDGGAVQF
jgi:NAD(P)-dependent dehydrogenase (short-subunit alcohol dehydrogenase family)